MDRIYAIVHATRKEAYIGRTYRSLEQRWAEHLGGAADPTNKKTLYEAMRFDPQRFEILECEHSETANEAHWIQLFLDDGYRILNDVPGNRKQPKRRNQELERVWRETNQKAYLRLGPQEYSLPWE